MIDEYIHHLNANENENENDFNFNQIKEEDQMFNAKKSNFNLETSSFNP
jgi:hypothetical protein